MDSIDVDAKCYKEKTQDLCTKSVWWLKFWLIRIEDAEMRRTFNMGIGMALVVTKDVADRILAESSMIAYRIGEVVHGEGVLFS